VREFAALQRKEQALKRQLAEFDTQQKQFAQDLHELVEFKKAREQAKVDPESYLRAAGLNYDHITDYYVNKRTGGVPQSHLEEVKAELEAQKKAVQEMREQSEKAKQEAAVGDFLRELKSTYASDDRFELIAAEDAYQDVYELIALNYQNTDGEVMDKEEAMQRVEEALYEDRLARYKKLHGLKKIQSAIAPPAPEEPKNGKSEKAKDAKAASTPSTPPPEEGGTDDWQKFLKSIR
jgi:hypothetical protein